MPMLELPFDVLSEHILTLLSPPDLLCFALTCNFAYSLVFTDSAHLWRSIYLSYYDSLLPAQSFLLHLLSDPRGSYSCAPGWDWQKEVTSRWRALELVRQAGEWRRLAAEMEGFEESLEEIGGVEEEGGDGEGGGMIKGNARRLSRLSAGKEEVQALIAILRTLAPAPIPSSPSTVSITAQTLSSTLLPHLDSYIPTLISSLTSFLLKKQRPFDLVTNLSRDASASQAFSSASSHLLSDSGYIALSHLLLLLPPPSANSATLPTKYRSLSRALIYSFSTHSPQTLWGPYLPRADPTSLTRGLRPSYPLLRAIWHVVSENIAEWEEDRWQRFQANLDTLLDEAAGPEEVAMINRLSKQHFSIGSPGGWDGVRSKDISRKELDDEERGQDWDWAGVEGKWIRVVSYLDFHDLFTFNFLPAHFIHHAQPDPTPLFPPASTATHPHQSSLENPVSFFDHQQEASRVLEMRLWVVGYEEEDRTPLPRTGKDGKAVGGGVEEGKGKARADMERDASKDGSETEGEQGVPGVGEDGGGWWPKRIIFEGKVDKIKGETLHEDQGGSEVKGDVSLMDEGEVRWRITSYRDGEPLWASEAIQPGGPQSERGCFGLWSGHEHDEQDPIGPFWMFKAPGPRLTADFATEEI